MMRSTTILGWGSLILLLGLGITGCASNSRYDRENEMLKNDIIRLQYQNDALAKEITLLELKQSNPAMTLTGQARSEIGTIAAVISPTAHAATPKLVAVETAPDVYYVRDMPNVFFYNDMWYNWNDGWWYSGVSFGGPWLFMETEFVPRPLHRVPGGYFHPGHAPEPRPREFEPQHREQHNEPRNEPHMKRGRD
jgi:hypothetical protein